MCVIKAIQGVFGGGEGAGRGNVWPPQALLMVGNSAQQGQELWMDPASQPPIVYSCLFFFKITAAVKEG